MSSNSAQSESIACLAWQNLSVVKHSLWGSTKKKTIVRGVSGRVGTRQLVALLGPSGAGKSTLLNALRGSAQGSTVHGEIYSTSPLRLCYIEQHAQNNVESSLTVGQLLNYAFHFKNGHKKPEVKERHVEQTLEELMLNQEILSKRFSDCSGGEQRRVVLAQELMSLEHKPQLLLLDEPSTGLDSSAALQLMTCLTRLAQSSQLSILLSIHQPSDLILDHFNHIYILARGGVTIYAGEPANLRGNLQTQLGIEVTCDKPPVEEYLKIGCDGLQSKDVLLLTSSLQSEASLHQDLPLQKHGLQSTNVAFSVNHLILSLRRTLRTTFISNRAIVLSLMIILLLWYLLTGYIFGSEMLQNRSCNVSSKFNNLRCSLEVDSEANHQTYMFYTLVNHIFLDVTIMIHADILAPSHVNVFRHEHQNGWYSLATFFLSYSAVALLETTLYALLSGVAIYFSVSHHALDGYQVNLSRLALFTTVHWIDVLYWHSLGQLVAALFPNSQRLTMIFGQLFYVTVAFSNGQAVVIESLNNVWFDLWAQINGHRYITKALIYSVYGLDGCNLDVIRRHYINPSTIYLDLLYALFVCLFLRVVVFSIHYLRYSLRLKKRLKSALENDWDRFQCENNNNNNELNQSIIIENDESKEFLHSEKLEPNCCGKPILAWSNLTLHITPISYAIAKNNGAGKPILRSLYGHLRFGQVTALMGASGAGKTTLLKVLSGQCNDKLSPESRFYLNRIQAISTCYLTQEVLGHLWPGLTVRQSLVYASRIKNASDEVPVDHNKTADYLIHQLQLEDAQHTLVNKCSGGERKRVALAQELTTRIMPNLVCLDEPTSGLDSNSALLVMSCMRRVAIQHQVSVVISVHQPSQDLLEHMDRLYCLSRGGLLIYQGTPESISSHLANFTSPSQYPIEQLIHYSCQGEQSETVEKLSQLATENEVQEMREEVKNMYPGSVSPNRIRFRFDSVITLSLRYTAYVFAHLWLQWLAYLFIFIGFAFTMRFIFEAKIASAKGCVRFEEDWDDKPCYREEEMTQLMLNFRYLAILLVSALFFVSIQGVFWLGDELIYLRNERRNGWYTSGVFYLTKSVAEALPTLILVLIFTYISDIWSEYIGGIFPWIVLPLLLAMGAMQTLGHIATMIAGKERLIQYLLATVFYFLSAAFTNYLRTSQTKHEPLRTLTQFSSIRMVQEAILALLYGFGRCGDREIPVVLHQAGIEHPEAHYYHCLRMLTLHLIVLRIVACLILARQFEANQSNVHSENKTILYKNKEGLSLGLGPLPTKFTVRQLATVQR